MTIEELDAYIETVAERVIERMMDERPALDSVEALRQTLNPAQDEGELGASDFEGRLAAALRARR